MTNQITKTNSRIRDRFLSFAPKIWFMPISGIALLILIFHRTGGTFVEVLKLKFTCILLVVSYILFGIRLNYSLSAINKQESFWNSVNAYFTNLEHKLDDVFKGTLALTVGVLILILLSSEIAYKGKLFELIFLFILIISVAWEYLIHRKFSKLVNNETIRVNTLTEAFSSWFRLDLLLAIFLIFFILFSLSDTLRMSYPLFNASVFFWVQILFSGRDLIKNQKLLFKEELSV